MTPLDSKENQPDFRYCCINWSEYPFFFNQEEKKSPPDCQYCNSWFNLFPFSIFILYNEYINSTTKISFQIFSTNNFSLYRFCIRILVESGFNPYSITIQIKSRFNYQIIFSKLGVKSVYNTAKYLHQFREMLED